MVLFSGQRFSLQSALAFSAARAPLSDCRGRGLALGLREPARGGARGAAVPLRRRCGDRPCSLRASRTREEPRRRAWLRAPSGAHSYLVSFVQDRWRSCACIARTRGLSDDLGKVICCGNSNFKLHVIVQI